MQIRVRQSEEKWSNRYQILHACLGERILL